MTNKYAEGYPRARYYGGCECVDIVEDLARDRLKEIFGAKHANVQPHSGAQANMAVYLAKLNVGDTVLGMNLSHGGHLSHGSKVNSSGKLYNFIPYGVDEKTGKITNIIIKTETDRAVNVKGAKRNGDLLVVPFGKVEKVGEFIIISGYTWERGISPLPKRYRIYRHAHVSSLFSVRFSLVFS